MTDAAGKRRKGVREPVASEPSDPPGAGARDPINHRTVDRVTWILEQVVYQPGMTFAELARAAGAPKSSVYGFVQGLLAKGWLYEQDRRFYLGPAVYSLNLASGHIRAGIVTPAALTALHEESGATVFLGVQAGDNLIYVAEAGSGDLVNFEVRSNIRRSLLATAGGKAILATRSDAELAAFLRRRKEKEPDLVQAFLGQYDEIKRTGIATNLRLAGARYALATTLHHRSGSATASVTLVGRTVDLQPKATELSGLLLRHVNSWTQPPRPSREPI